LRYKRQVLGKLFLAFTILPLVDLYVLLQIGERIGGTSALALVIVTGVLGAALARTEGVRVLRAWQQALAAGRVPEEGVVSGVLVLIGGALLITPGVISDGIGLLLLVPFTRRPIAAFVAGRVRRAIERGAIRVVHTQVGMPGMPGPFPPRGHGGGRGPMRGPVIDVEGETVDERRPSSSNPRGSLEP
jgi:UPF0716 protein FxsA